MAMPKKRMSHARSGNRRSHLALQPIQLRACSNCKEPGRSHQICTYCGFYRGRLIQTPTQTPQSEASKA